MNPCFAQRAVRAIASRACMPSSLKYGGSNYYNLGLVTYYVASDYPRNLRRGIRGRHVRSHDRVHVGSTERSAGYREMISDIEVARVESYTVNGWCAPGTSPDGEGRCE